MVVFRKFRFGSNCVSRIASSRIATLLGLVTQIRNLLTDKQHVTLNHLATRFGDRFRIRLGFGTAVFFSDPAAVSKVLSLDNTAMATGVARRRLAGMFPEKCLLYADGDEHVRMRKAIAKAFGESAKSFDRQRQLESLVLRIRSDNSVDTTEAIFDYIVESTSHFILGDAPIGLCRSAKNVMAQFTGIPTAVIILPFLRDLPFHRRRFQDYALAQQQFAGCIETHSEFSPTSFVSAMKRQQAAGNLTHAEVVDNAAFFFLVMIRTLRTLFSNVARTMAVESRWQDRLRQVEQTQGGLVAARLRRAVVKETIRLLPFAPIYVRKAMIDQDIDGFPIRKGEYVIFSPDLIHHRESTFPNPNSFSPERFLKKQRHGSFVPFGGGTRHCIGSGWVIDSLAELLQTLLPHVDFQAQGSHFGMHDFSMNTIFRTPRRDGFSTHLRAESINTRATFDVPAIRGEAV